MSGDPFQRIAGYYDDLVAKHGNHPRASDYGRVESQQTKFGVLSTVLPAKPGRRVLDVGCGQATFAGHLERAWGGVQYSGIDLSASQIAKGKELFPALDLKQANLFDLPATQSFDVVFANGIFYLLGDKAPQLMRDLVSAMFARASQAIAFNSLSTWAADPEAGEFYANPAEVLDFARSLSPWVVLRHDYHHRDFTVFIYRERQT